MEPAYFDRLMQLFQQVCELPEPARAAFLDREAPDRKLRRELDAMLRHDSEADSALAAPGAGAYLLAQQIAATDPAPPVPTDSPYARGSVLSGQYRILRIVGEGGMGVVYEAEQAWPRRRVALKAVRPGMASRQMLRRFEREAHILGRLHHPGIAQIYEAGAADENQADQAYFVMEYVDGLPLTTYAERNGLSTRERLALFMRICEAVQHAHHRGVIHRDLKPANIVVTQSGEPKVLDFGVARFSHEGHVTTLQTISGQLIGTLPYMSPEQVCGDPREIDTRTDVYALGVVLYQLLSGKLPLDLEKRSIAEAARIICEEPPRRLGAVCRELRGEVDTIVSRAMERDASRRYQSAADLGADLRAHLRGEPIIARSDSLLYVARKRLWRHRASVLAATCILLLVSALAIMAWERGGRNRRPSARQVSDHMQALVRAHRARSAGDHKKYKELIAYLQSELSEPEHRIVALIDDNVPALRGDGGPTSMPIP